MIRRHSHWNTGWELMKIDKMLKGMGPEEKILALGLYIDEIGKTTDPSFTKRVSKKIVQEEVDELLVKFLKESEFSVSVA